MRLLTSLGACDWPLADSREKGCVPGDCSYRPDDPAEQRRISQRRAQLREQRQANRKERSGVDVEEALTLDDLPQCSAGNGVAKDRVRHIVRNLASVNMTEDVAERQARRITDALEAAGLIADEPQPTRQWPRVFNVQRSKFNHWHADISFARCPTDEEIQALEISLRDDRQPAPSLTRPELGGGK
jgi:hypothetical protein